MGVRIPPLMQKKEVMEKNEIKKALYKQNPEANFQLIRKGVAYYAGMVDIEGYEHEIRFEIPVSDMGDSDFIPLMPAKLLIRWIV
jgi:hypothetical protein